MNIAKIKLKLIKEQIRRKQDTPTTYALLALLRDSGEISEEECEEILGSAKNDKDG